MAIGRRELTFLWSVDHYSYSWHENGSYLLSPAFIEDSIENTTWWIRLCPRGRTIADKGFVSLHLRRSTAGAENVTIQFEVSILAENGSSLASKEYEHSFGRDGACGDDHFLKMEQSVYQRYFPKDVLTVRCRMWVGKGDVHRVTSGCARTRIAVETISFIHEVENFSKLYPNQKHYHHISSHLKKKCFVTSSLYFNHDSNPEGEMIVEITPSVSDYILCKERISLLRYGKIIICRETDNRFDVKRKDIRKLSFCLTKQDILNNEIEYLSAGKLSLLCECRFSTGQEFNKIEEVRYKMPTAVVNRTNNQEISQNDNNTAEKVSIYPSVLEDIKTIYMDKCLTDVELKTKTKSFPAHKVILCLRSPIFEQMLTIDMRNRNATCIEVDDLEDDVMQQLLLFLYSDSIQDLQWTMATRLYYSAYKYKIGKLKEICSSFLVEHLDRTTAGELLLLADIHGDKDLKKVAEDFILEHETDVFGSKEWDMLMEINLQLAAKTMQLKYKRRNEVHQ